MGTWTREFVNMTLAAPTDPAAWLRDRVAADALLPEHERTEKTVYFPPRQGGAVWWVTARDTVLTLPPHFTVMIAPGATIGALGPRAKLILLGELQAPVAQIFPSAALPPPNVPPGDVGKVSLLGDRLERVHPAWWGGGAEEGPDIDLHALEEAVRVASEHGAWLGQTPVVELLGRYRINRSLRLFHDTSLLEPSLELRGRPGAEDDATLTAADDFVGDALLDLGTTGSRVVCQDLRFDAGFRTRVCVQVAAQVSLGAAPALRLPHEFNRCGFRGALTSELLVVDRGPLVAQARGQPPTTVDAQPVVDVNGAMFRVARRPVGAPAQVASSPRVAARLLGPEGATTRFFNCTFVGEAHAMIYASAHDVVTTGCRFENTMIPAKLTQPTPADWRALHAVQLEGGVDLVLEAYPLEDEVTYRVTGDGLGPVGKASAKRRDTGGTAYVGPYATLTAQDCRSTSPQFLVARPAGTLSRAGRDSTVIGLHHAFDRTRAPAVVHPPPAVHWRAREGALSSPSLHLIGCRIDRDPMVTTPMVLAPDGGDGRPTVFDYGTSSDGRPLRTPVGQGGERFPGVFAPTRAGFVPFRVRISR